jgi:hypothetical protein
MTWNLRKLCGILTYDERIDKEEADKKTLEKWRNEIEDRCLNLRGSKISESPYITYFFKHCKYCCEFVPDGCFDNDGHVYINCILKCSKLRLNMKLLQNEPKCSCNK